MTILVFKTSLSSKEDVNHIGAVLNSHPQVLTWNVDLEDCENILRIETKDCASMDGIRESVRMLGFDCENLDH